jgi:hypothetical protein
MPDIFIPKWHPKDATDKRPKNFNAASSLAADGNPAISTAEVFVEGIVAANGTIVATDGLLVISDVVWDAVTKRVSFWWSGGTVGTTYRVTCRLLGANGYSSDQSADVLIVQK